MVNEFRYVGADWDRSNNENHLYYMYIKFSMFLHMI